MLCTALIENFLPLTVIPTCAYAHILTLSIFTGPMCAGCSPVDGGDGAGIDNKVLILAVSAARTQL